MSLGTVDIHSLPRSDQQALFDLLTPRATEYIVHKPYPKQAAFMLLDCKEAFYGGAAGGGKALALDTPILTKAGWKLFGDLVLDDQVLAVDGTWTEIEYITEVQENHTCYRVLFNTGEAIIADEEHLWVTTEFKHRKYWVDNIVQTRQLGAGNKITTRKAVQGTPIDINIDPYILGYWLGDGNSRTGSITCHDSDVANLAQYCTLHAYASMPMQYTVDGLTTQLKQLGLLRSKNDNRQSAPETKHIPEMFFTSSYEQRLALLQGIMDSDGSIQERGRCEIGLKEGRLASDVCTLLASLGIVFSRNMAKTSYQGKSCPSHRITFSTTMPVFRLPRKLERLPQKICSNKILVDYMGKCPSVPVKCIRIKHPSHTFLVGKTLIPTHNSDALLMCALQYVDTPGYSAIIFRKSFADLVKPGALIDRAQEWLAPWTASKQVRWVEKEKKFIFPSGAILQFGYLETPNDRFNYQGGEYQFIGFDEVTHISQICYTYLFSRLRRLKGVEIPLRVRAASNPPDDGDDAEWVYNRFVNEETKKPHVVFIPAGMDDNPYLDKDSYVESLEELDPVARARLRDGVWTIVRKGNMFKREWFGYVDAAPQGRRRVRFWDCAATEVNPVQKRRGKDPDWTVGFLLSEFRGTYYIEDIAHVQMSALNVEQLQKSTATSDGYGTRIREEEEPGASGKFTIEKKKKELLKGYAYEGVKSTGSKIQRAMAVSAASERGIIKIVRGCRNLEKFFNEIEGFPGAGHDDLVDGFSGAFNALGTIPLLAAPTEVMPVNREISHWFPDGEPVEHQSYWQI